ncbi:MAG: hypothetical protein HOB73_16155 [Planctomycetaceae bacterium]|nr:hypothetical protein [Planctomycetaceae bacterium]
MNILNRLVICTVSFALPMFSVDANDPSNREHHLNNVVRKQFSGQQKTKMQSSQISATEKKLQRTIDAVFSNAPLSQVLDSLGTKLDVQFYVDERALAEIGLDNNASIDFNLKNVKAELALELMLKQIHLVWFARNGLVHVTTREVAANELEVRIYRCRDFLEIESHPPGQRAMDGGMSRNEFRNRHRTLNDLVKLIPRVIYPMSWEDLGGTGNIGTLPDGILVIAQTRRVHAEVQHLLQTIRMLRKRDANGVNQQAYSISDTEQKLQQQIDALFIDTPLSEILESLGSKLDVQFYIDERALLEVGMDRNSPVSLDLKDVKAELAFEMMMKQIGLVYFVYHDLIRVTTPEAAENDLVLRVYSCEDFLDPTDRTPRRRQQNQTQPKLWGGGSDTSALYQNKRLGNLIEVIQTNIARDSWEVVGGAGVIRNFYEMLVVVQMPSIHRKVEALLSGLRKAKKPIRGTLFHLR